MEGTGTPGTCGHAHSGCAHAVMCVRVAPHHAMQRPACPTKETRAWPAPSMNKQTGATTLTHRRTENTTAAAAYCQHAAIRECQASVPMA